MCFEPFYATHYKWDEASRGSMAAATSQSAIGRGHCPAAVGEPLSQLLGNLSAYAARKTVKKKNQFKREWW